MLTEKSLRRSIPFLVSACAIAASVGTNAQTTNTFIEGEGRKTVEATCTRCHSSTLVTQNSGSEYTWRIRVRLMQTSHGMSAIDEATESTIVDYLAAYYGQKASARRAALKPKFMPANPYEQEPAAD